MARCCLMGYATEVSVTLGSEIDVDERLIEWPMAATVAGGSPGRDRPTLDRVEYARAGELQMTTAAAALAAEVLRLCDEKIVPEGDDRDRLR